VTVARVGWPGLLGLVFLLFGLQSLANGIQSGNAGELADHVRTSAVPNGIGIVLLLAAFAIWRRTRGGLVLGMVVGVLGVASGVALIVLEIQYVQGGGAGAPYAAVFYVIGGTWSLLWLLSTWRLWAARSVFATTWVPSDRRVGLAAVAAIIVATGLFLGIQPRAAADAVQDARVGAGSLSRR
jgi:hypothetical protein